MMPRVVVLALVVVALACGTQAKALPDAPDTQQQQVLDPYGNHLVDDDGSLDAALINYLFAKQMAKRLMTSADVTELQRKRSYWKQCAFNAVSCFGKRK